MRDSPFAALRQAFQPRIIIERGCSASWRKPRPMAGGGATRSTPATAGAAGDRSHLSQPGRPGGPTCNKNGLAQIGAAASRNGCVRINKNGSGTNMQPVSRPGMRSQLTPSRSPPSLRSAEAEPVQHDPRGGTATCLGGLQATADVAPQAHQGLETSVAALISARVSVTAKPMSSRLMRRSGGATGILSAARLACARASLREWVWQ